MTSNLQYTFNNDSTSPEIWDSLFADHLTDYDEEPVEPDPEADECEEDRYDDRPLNNERE